MENAGCSFGFSISNARLAKSFIVGPNVDDSLNPTEHRYRYSSLKYVCYPHVVFDGHLSSVIPRGYVLFKMCKIFTFEGIGNDVYSGVKINLSILLTKITFL